MFYLNLMALLKLLYHLILIDEVEHYIICKETFYMKTAIYVQLKVTRYR